ATLRVIRGAMAVKKTLRRPSRFQHSWIGSRPEHARRPARGAAVALGLALLWVAGCGHRESRSRAAWDPDSIPDAYATPSGALLWPGASRAWYVTPEGHLY